VVDAKGVVVFVLWVLFHGLALRVAVAGEFWRCRSFGDAWRLRELGVRG
jgi:hypothetical protein